MNGVAPDGREAARLIADLRQPLAAASNYVGAARTILQSADGDQNDAAVAILEKAGDQILRAGDLVRELRSHLK